MTLSGMRAASARQPISMELKCADSSNTPRPVACAALRFSRPVISVMCRMRSFDDHQLIAVSNSAQPRPAKCSRRMRSRAAATSSGSASSMLRRAIRLNGVGNRNTNSPRPRPSR